MLRNLRIGARLALGFGVIVLVMATVAVAATIYGQESRRSLAALIEAASAKEALAAEMKALLLEQSSAMRNVGLQSEVKDMQDDEDRARRLGVRYRQSIETMASLPLTPEEASILAAVRTAYGQIEKPFRKALALATAFQSEAAARVIRAEVDPPVQKTLAELNHLVDLQKAANRAAIERATASGDQVALGVFAVQGAAFVLSLLMAWMVTRSITVPLRAAVAVTSRVAQGDLTGHIGDSGRDEAADLLRSLSAMNEGLGNMVTRIRAGAESIAVGASQVSAGNQQLSSRTEEQASSLEETAATLEEFTGTVRRNADHARQASQLASGASATAQRGGEAVGKVVATMQEVTASSRRITDIVGVIDGIAFQTNILALNAAVEAARAGEQGRGFAVVASEVRNLAQRSAASAKEIRGLIEESVGRVESGARQVEQAGKTMDELVGPVKRVAEIMTEIAAASSEQSEAIEQINRAIIQMDQVVQTNASLVEEATAAAASMASQAAGLAHSVAQFRVEEGAAILSPPVAGRSLPAAAGPGAVRVRTATPPRGGDERREAPLADPSGDDEWKEF